IPSRDSFADRSPAIIDLGPIRPRGRGAYHVGTAAEETPATTDGGVQPLATILKTFAVTILAVCLFGAQGLTSQAQTMGGPAGARPWRSAISSSASRICLGW